MQHANPSQTTTLRSRLARCAGLAWLLLSLTVQARAGEDARLRFEQTMDEITRDLPDLVVTSTFRTEADQTRLLRAGYTPHPHSQHKLGLAWDCSGPPEILETLEERAEERGFVALAMRSPVTGSRYLHVQRYTRSPLATGSGRIAPTRVASVAWDPRVTAPLAVLSAGPEIEMPRPIGISGLDFPRRLLRRPAQGTVTLLVTLSAEGEVRDVRVDSSDLPRFDAFVTSQVRGWRFSPPRRRGQPIEAVARLPIPIHIN